MEATEGIFEKIRPPRIEDAGLEDCALPPESIKEAFLKAASAVRSSLLSDDEDESTCVHDPWTSAGEDSDALVGITPENEAPGGCAGNKGGEVPERLGDKVVDGLSDADVAKGDEVVGGGPVNEEGECCVEELKGLKIGEKTEKKHDAKESDRPILTEDKQADTKRKERKCEEAAELKDDEASCSISLNLFKAVLRKDWVYLMAKSGKKMAVLRLTASGFLLIATVIVSAERGLKQDTASYSQTPEHVAETNYLLHVVEFLWQEGQQGYVHVWPEMKLGWRIIVGTIIGFLGAALGSVGGVGGGGIYVPMLALIIGFDAKSSTALSKCIITGAAGASVYYNLKLRHPTLNLPIIDYDLALLFQPMLVLGISIGVTLNVMFADWMVTVLLIVLFMVTSTKAFLKGVETWKLETMVKKEASKHLTSNGNEGDGEVVAYIPLPGGPSNNPPTESNESKASEISLFGNICWKELGILVAVWVIILALQLAKNHMPPCSPVYWVWNLLQIPVAVGASGYEAVGLYTGRRVIASKGEAGSNFKWHQLVLYCCYGVVAGMVGGLLGLGGGFILGPLFLELGIPPQVSSATATFAMTFSASMSVVEYYLLKRFPVPYALYFVAVAMVAALTGQHVVRKIIDFLGRASLIIFILSFTIFVSAVSLGGIGIVNMIDRMERNEYMGFEDICSYKP